MRSWALSAVLAVTLVACRAGGGAGDAGGGGGGGPFGGSDAGSDAGTERHLPTFTSSGDYGVFSIGPWEVHMNQALIAQEPLALDVIDHLTEDIASVEAKLPAAPYEYLSTNVHIYLELELPLVPGGTYHPSAAWLSSNGYPTEWAKNIQLGNAANYLSWTDIQPAMVMHELAHAWQDQHWSGADGFISTAYQGAMDAHLYDSVLYATGSYQQAYATTNFREYFAELTEAYFWENDFYPMVRSELLTFDPTGASAVETAWAP